jgi:hypothetical protein
VDGEPNCSFGGTIILVIECLVLEEFTVPAGSESVSLPFCPFCQSPCGGVYEIISFCSMDKKQ